MGLASRRKHEQRAAHQQHVANFAVRERAVYDFAELLVENATVVLGLVDQMVRTIEQGEVPENMLEDARRVTAKGITHYATAREYLTTWKAAMLPLEEQGQLACAQSDKLTPT